LTVLIAFPSVTLLLLPLLRLQRLLQIIHIKAREGAEE